MKDDLIYRREAIKTMRRLEPSFKGSFIEQAMLGMPGVPEIIHCKDCKHYASEVGDESFALGWCPFIKSHLVMSDGFCAWAERRSDAKG